MNFFTKLWNNILGTSEPLRPRASSIGYNAGSTGRRASGWNASRLGPNVLLLNSLDQLRARSRDAIRNDPMGRSACDKFQSNVIGTGIVPHFLHPDTTVKETLQAAWAKWIKTCDYQGQLNFYGLQTLVARELFEAGEVFCRFHVDATVGLQCQLLESEQCPIYQNSTSTNPAKTTKAGIVFDANDRRIGYEMYSSHPYDFISGSFMSTTQYVFVPAEEMLHIVRPLRAGQLRGEPQLAPVLTLLKDLGDYADSERLRKKICAMFAGFITKPQPDTELFPPMPYRGTEQNWEDPSSTVPQAQPDGVEAGMIEPGSLQQLIPGEGIEFPQVPDSGDYAVFMKTELHKFAAGSGITYEQLTSDLDGATYSSLRAGLLEFRRQIEQFQANVIVHQLCEPVLSHWLKEAVLSGAVVLPDDYYEDASPYESAVWVSPGWQWVDPAKEIASYQMAVRSGFTSRTMVVRESGYDPSVIDAQVAEERARAAKLGIIFDSDPNKVLIGRETQPLDPTNVDPDQESEDDSEDDDSE